MTLAIGSDHAGFTLKEDLRARLEAAGHTLVDEGTYSDQRANYATYAHKVAEMVKTGLAQYGVLVCGSGQGVCMTANRHHGVRAGLVYSQEVASLVREHNDANIICLPARAASAEEAVAWVQTFLETPFAGGRHEERVQAIERPVSQ